MNRTKVVRLGLAIFLALLVGLFVSQYYEPKISNTIIIPLIAGLITIMLGTIRYWIDYDQMFKSLFEGFNARFDDINETLNLIYSGNFVESQNSKTQEEILQDYLNLCAEEYLWYKKGRIDKTVWASWKAGIKYYLRNPEIKKFFDDQKEFNLSYYGLFDNLNKK